MSPLRFFRVFLSRILCQPGEVALWAKDEIEAKDQAQRYLDAGVCQNAVVHGQWFEPTAETIQVEEVQEIG